MDRAASTHAPEPPGAAVASPWRTFALSGLAVFLVSLDATVMVAAFPALRADFAAVSAALLSWTLNAYTIVYAALLVPAGRMADLLGRKRLFLWGVGVFTLASALCALALGPVPLVAARVAQAIGAALLTPTSLALVLAAFPPARRAAAVGLWSAVGALAAAVGPAFGSLVIAQASWRWVFLINVPVGAVAWLRARRQLPELSGADAGARPDLAGIALLIAGVAAIADAIVEIDPAGCLPVHSTIAGGAGLALLLAFVAWARGRADAALDLSLFDDRGFRWISVASLVFGAAFSAMFLSAFLFQMGVWGWSQSLAGLAVTPGPLIVIPVAMCAGKLAARVGHRWMLVAGGLLYALGQGWLAWRIGATADYLRVWLPSQVVTGVAIGLVLPALSAAAVAWLPPARFGVGSGVNNALRQIGGAIGAAVAVALVGRSGAGVEAFRTLYELLALAGVAIAVLALPLAARGAPAPAAASVEAAR
ncbi:MAG: MFS transporter [Burkholderiales bacterium]|nr:MFS transporter [Burkholderiales bacterium]